MSTYAREARGSLIIVWVCDACGDEVDAHKDAAKDWVRIEVGTWRSAKRALACSAGCAYDVLTALGECLLGEDTMPQLFRPMVDVVVQEQLL